VTAPPTVVELLRDVASRVVRLDEALADGEYDLAAFLAEDLERDTDVWIRALRERVA
jgi:hypothetical protein